MQAMHDDVGFEYIVVVDRVILEDIYLNCGQYCMGCSSLLCL